MKKTWVPIIVSIISLLTALGVAWIQTGSVTKEDHAHTENQVNHKLMPGMEDKLTDLAVKLSKLEGKIEVMEKMIEKPGAMKPPTPMKIVPRVKLPRLEQRAY